MQHTIELERLGAPGPEMAHAVEKCVHCGFCLAACPTYKVLGEEMDSPRGRIYLMKEQMEGNLALDEMMPFIDSCLGCMACVTACPSGVEYGELLTPFRAQSEETRSRTLMERTTRLLVRETLPYPDRFRLAATMGKFAMPFKKMLPDSLGAMLDLLPDSLPSSDPLPDIYPAQGETRARVALLSGCVQQVLSPSINWATLRVLSRNGVEVIIPRGQGCCGSLAMHNGEGDHASALARRNLTVFGPLIERGEIDAVITNAAGCGSGMQEYGLLFKGTNYAERAQLFANNVQDVSLFLDSLGLVEPPPALPEALTVAYHDACHLAHAQGVTSPPRRLLRSIPNLSLVEVPEGEICCGSAGTYNLEQPEIANTLGERKVDNIVSTGAQAVVTGNIGCMTQIQTHLLQKDKPLPLWHTIELLELAYEGAEAQG